MPFKHIGSANYNLSAANETINLATYEIDSVPAGQSGGPGGIIPKIGASDHSERGLQIVIDNTKGGADVYLATKAEIDAATGAPTETEPVGALVVRATEADTFGPYQWREWDMMLRCLAGAHVRVSVEFSGQGIR